MWSARQRVLVLVTVAAVTAAWLPPVHAQGVPEPKLSLVVPAATEALAPEEERHTRTVQVVLDCSSPASPLPVDVALTITSGDTWADVNVTPPNVRFETCPPGQVATQEVQVEIDLAEDAPGSGDLYLELAATSESTSTRAEWHEQVALRMDSTVRFDKSEFKTGPNARVAIPTTIENHGNNEIIVHFQLADNSSSHLNVALPGTQLVEAGGVQQLAIDIATPFENGYMEQKDELHVVVTRTSVANETVSEEETLTATVETVGTYVPGPAFGLLLVALLAFARLQRGTGSKP